MTLPVAPLPSDESQRAERAGAQSQRQAQKAAKEFETLFVQQMMKVMRTSMTRGMSESAMGGSQYMQMFDAALANSITETGALDLQRIFTAGFDDEDAPVKTVHAMAPLRAGAMYGVIAPSSSGPPLRGATGAMQRAAAQLIGVGGAERWGREGRLLPQDLASNYAARLQDGKAKFNVNDASGYQGYYKCNLFAFELARRAGFQVPVVGRKRGFGYPVSSAVAQDAASNRQVRGNWGRVVTGEGASSLDAGLLQGSRAFMLAASASDPKRAGHMAVVERVREVKHDNQGKIKQIVFDGWEARSKGARHLQQRTWNRSDTHGGHDVRGGFGNIEVIELKPAQRGKVQEVALSKPGLPSKHDIFASSSPLHRPIARREGT